MAMAKITIEVDTSDALRWLHEAQAGRGVDITDEVEDMRRRLADADKLLLALRAAEAECEKLRAQSRRRLADVTHILDAYMRDDMGRLRPRPLRRFRAQHGPGFDGGAIIDGIVSAVSEQAAADALLDSIGGVDLGDVRVWRMDDTGTSVGAQLFTLVGQAEHHRSRGEWAARVEKVSR